MERRRPTSDKTTQRQLQIEAFWRGLDGKTVDIETVLFLLLDQAGFHLLISGELTTTFTLKNGRPAETLHYATRIGAGRDEVAPPFVTEKLVSE
jgi:hypothetical protein